MADRGRFWGADDDDDEEDGEEGGELGGGGGFGAAGAAGAGAKGGAGPSAAAADKSKARFVDLESDSESDEEKRVVRTAKDKKWDAMLSIIATLTKHLRANNWVEVEDCFERLNKALRDASAVVVKEGLPRFYVRTLMELEDAVNSVTRAATKDMSKSSATAYNRVKMNLKKYINSNPALGLAAAVEAYRKDPDAEAKDENEVRREAKKAASSAKAAAAGADDDSDGDEVVIGRMGVQVNVKKRAIVDEEEDEDEDEDEDEEDDDEGGAGAKAEGEDEDEDEDFGESSSDDESEEDEAFKGLTGRAKWVKREVTGKSKDEKESEKAARRAGQDAKLRAKKERVAKDDAARAAREPGMPAAAPGASATVIDLAMLESRSLDVAAAVQAKKWSRGMLEDEVRRVLALRGRKGADTKLLVAYLGALADKALEFGPHVSVPALIQAVSARFSLSASRLDAFLDRASWKRSLRDIGTIISILEAEPRLRLGAVAAEDIAELMAKRDKRGGILGGKGKDGGDAADDAAGAGASNAAASAGGAAAAAVENDPNAFVVQMTPAAKRRAAQQAAAAAAAAAEAAAAAGEATSPRAQQQQQQMQMQQFSQAVSAAQAARAAADASDPHLIRVVGDLSVLLVNLQDEYSKSLQHMDVHKQEYVVRISDETALTAAAERCFEWYLRQIDIESAKTSPGEPKSDVAATLEGAATRLAGLRIEHMYYKHDSVAYALRVSAHTADKRSEVAAVAAAAAMQAMDEARRAAIEAGRSGAGAGAGRSDSAAAAAAGSAAGTPTASSGVASPTAAGSAGEKEAREAAENVSKAVSAAANASVVGDAAARLASASVVARGKRGFAAAAGIVAKAVVVELSRREGGLLSGAAVGTSRSAADMETLADLEAAKALADAETLGVDLGELRTVSVKGGAPGEVVGVPVVDTQAVIARLANFIYRHGDSRSKNKAVLGHVFHHALHDRFSEARDLLVMSRCQDSIAGLVGEARSQPENVRVQILYNRALTMLGICAFRAGAHATAHECLAEICGSGHTKELLAQGLTQFKYGQLAERDPETEREERRRLVPYHMHINVELADACHLTSAMLLEVPNIAAAEFDPRRREISKSFRRHLDQLESKSFVGPPETTRDSIMLAALALAEGEWRRATDLIVALKVWQLWTPARGGDRIRAALVQAIKEAGLITYLHTFSQFYESLSRDSLCEMFELPAQAVQGTCSRLMHSGELAAKWDQPTNTIVVLRAPPTKLQALALDFANHVAAVAESNERAMMLRSGNFGGDRGGRGGGRGGFSSEGGGGGEGGGGRGGYGGGGGRGGFGGGERGGYRGGRGGRGRGGFGGDRGGRGGRGGGGYGGQGRRAYGQRGY